MLKTHKKTILEIGKSGHKEFVDCMYPEFFIDTHPGYSPVAVKPLLYAAGVTFNPDTIILSDLQHDETGIFDSVYHESTHLLHPFSRDLYYRVGRETWTKQIDFALLEIIAHLGSIKYLALKHNRQRIEKYIRERPLEACNIDTALKLHELNPELLGKLSNTDVETANKIIRDVL